MSSMRPYQCRNADTPNAACLLDASRPCIKIARISLRNFHARARAWRSSPTRRCRVLVSRVSSMLYSPPRQAKGMCFRQRHGAHQHGDPGALDVRRGRQKPTGLLPQRTHWCGHGPAVAGPASHRARLADCGALGGASVNHDAANQRSPTSCRQPLSRPPPSPSARCPTGVQAARKRKRRKSPIPPPRKPPKPAEAQREERVTKQERLLTLLSQPEGASIEDMMQATKWQQHSVRGFLAGTVKKKLGFALTSSKSEWRRPPLSHRDASRSLKCRSQRSILRQSSLGSEN